MVLGAGEKQKSSNPLKFLVSLFLSFCVQPRCGGSIRRISDAFIALPEALSLTRCPACGGNHYWTKSQTWICSVESSLRALLPAEIVGGH